MADNDDGPAWPDDWPVQHTPPDIPEEQLLSGEALQKLAGCDIHLPRSVTRSTQHLFVLPGILSLPKKPTTAIGTVKGLGTASSDGQTTDVSLQLGKSLAMSGRRVWTKAKFLALSVKKNKITVKAILSSVHIFGEVQCLKEHTDKAAGIFHHSGVSLRAEKRAKALAKPKSPAKRPQVPTYESGSNSDESSIRSFSEARHNLESPLGNSLRRSSRKQQKSISLAEEDSSSVSDYSSMDEEEDPGVPAKSPGRDSFGETPRQGAQAQDAEAANANINTTDVAARPKEAEKSSPSVESNVKRKDPPTNDNNEIDVTTPPRKQRRRKTPRSKGCTPVEAAGSSSSVSTETSPSLRKNASDSVEEEKQSDAKGVSEDAIASNPSKFARIGGVSPCTSPKPGQTSHQQKQTSRDVGNIHGEHKQRPSICRPTDSEAVDESKKYQKSVVETPTSRPHARTPPSSSGGSKRRRRRPGGKRPRSLWDSVEEGDNLFSAKFDV